MNVFSFNLLALIILNCWFSTSSRSSLPNLRYLQIPPGLHHLRGFQSFFPASAEKVSWPTGLFPCLFCLFCVAYKWGPDMKPNHMSPFPSTTCHASAFSWSNSLHSTYQRSLTAKVARGMMEGGHRGIGRGRKNSYGEGIICRNTGNFISEASVLIGL